MDHIGLFEGIGGFSLAAQMIGWHTIAVCENNPFCQQVLKYHFPKAKQHGDITTTDFTIYRGLCGIVTGGFPCQPYSTAGNRLGTEDERHLWPQMLRAVREIQPRYVVGENVRGLTNWNGGLVFDQVQADLEAEGYEVLPFLLPACAVNAPHRRDRIWFVAYSVSAGTRNKSREISDEGWRTGESGAESIRQVHGQTGSGWIDSTSANEIITNTTGIGGNEVHREIQSGFTNGHIINGVGNECNAADTTIERLERAARASIQSGRDGFACSNQQSNWHNFPTVSPICTRNDGVSYGLHGITFSKWRNEALKALGNAIVPEVAFQIFKAIAVMEADTCKKDT